MTDNTSGLLEEISILQACAADMAGEIDRLTAELAASRAKVDDLKRNGDDLLTAYRYACKWRDNFEADTTRLLGQLADMTRRKDGWRGVAMLYRGDLIDVYGLSRVLGYTWETWRREWSTGRRWNRQHPEELDVFGQDGDD